MFNSTLLEVFIGLAFVYLLLSLALASVNEMITAFFKIRNGVLERAITGILGDDVLVDCFYNHPFVRGMSSSKVRSTTVRVTRRLLSSKIARKIGIVWILEKLHVPQFARRIAQGRPSYLASKTFALVFADMLATEYAPLKKKLALTTDIDRNLLKNLRSQFSLFAEKVNDPEMRDCGLAEIAEWYDGQMERVSGWYKRLNQKILLVVALFMTIALNADTLMIANLLWNDSMVRDAVITEAEATVQRARGADEQNIAAAVNTTENEVTDPCKGCRHSAVVVAMNNRKSRPFPVGWTTPSTGLYQELRSLPDTLADWIYKVIGLLLTTTLVSLGAPFWFDMLSKLVNLRNTGIKPKTAAEKSSN